ncbi:urocanate hydratase [bacterium]|nr:urocanate hydratase [candidate division CSSED10-310 bacterium]
MSESFQSQIRQGIPVDLPPAPQWDDTINHAPARPLILTDHEQQQALMNALRYFPEAWHETLATEFAAELLRDGKITMRRFRPSYPMKARPIGEYPARCSEAAAIMLMIQNNLDPDVAQHPHELITYGGNGAVFQNWAQYLLTMHYLSEMEKNQTLVLYSGHPLGLFPSSEWAPRLVVSNGMMIPNYSTPDDYLKFNAMGVTSYGQMTAGSFMYIGPQGIVHGTTITILNAARKYLGIPADESLGGITFVTSGLGGMSGAQAKAGVIAGTVNVIAEINPKPLYTRHRQGWLTEVQTDLDRLMKRIENARKNKEAVSIGYLGNIIDLWEKLDDAGLPVELGSDQTSLHNPFGGGYYPAGLSYEASNHLIKADPGEFKARVQDSLRRHFKVITTMTDRGMFFWDYGNAFLLEASRAGAEGALQPDGSFQYPSYVEDIMGPMCFDFGFGPFRWVCCSGNPADLRVTDRIAEDTLQNMLNDSDPQIRQQLKDNLDWIRSAEHHQLVVGSQARILYSNEEGRIRIALAFNQAIRDGRISAPIVLGRDHHDVSGTDSPFRETANIRDGSNRTADMAVHNVIGDAMRGATWVSLHNGGGVGWGEVINGGFGMVLDGSSIVDRRITEMLQWDVNNGIARRAWATNPGALFAIKNAMDKHSDLKITLPFQASTTLVRNSIEEAAKSIGSP